MTGPRSWLFASAGAMALAACGGDGGTTTIVPLPVVPPGITITLGPTVPATTRAQLVSFVGAADSTGVTGTPRLALSPVSVTAGPTAVVALNARGEAVLGAIARTDAPASLDAVTTAHLLLRLVLPPALSAPLDQATLEAAAGGLPAFQLLTDSIRASSARGESYAAPQNVAAAAQAVRDLLAAQPPQAAVSRSAGPIGARAATSLKPAVIAAQIADTTPFPVTFALIGGAGPGGQLTITSRAWVPLVVTGAPGGAIALPRREVCLFCATPTQAAPVVTRTIALPADGALPLAVEFGVAGRESTLRQTALDLVQLQLRLATGVASPLDSTRSLRALALTGLSTAGIVAGGSSPVWTDAVAVVTSAMQGASLPLASGLPELVPGYVARPGIASLMRELSVPLLRLQAAAWTSDRYPYYAEVAQVWSRPPEPRQRCVERGTLYGACVARVVITPSNTAVDLGQTQLLTATVYDSLGNVLTDRSVRWSVDSTGRNLLALGTTTALTANVSGSNIGGPVLVTATAGTGVSAVASVAVEQDLTGYTIEIQNYDAETQTYSPRLTLKPGDAYTAPMKMQQRFKIMYNGVSVVSNPTGVETLFFGDGDQFSRGATDVRIPNYRVLTSDAVRRRTLYFPLDLTLSNEAYRRLVGRTFVMTLGASPVLERYHITLKPDGTCLNLFVSPSGATTEFANCSYTLPSSIDQLSIVGCLSSGARLNLRLTAQVAFSPTAPFNRSGGFPLSTDGTVGYRCELALQNRWFVDFLP